MKEFEKIVLALEQELQTISDKDISPIEKAEQSMAACSDCLKRLKALVASHSFDQEDKEIRFFKQIKPRIVAKLLYFKHIRKMERKTRHLDQDCRLQYYRKKLSKIQRFQKRNEEFIEYYESNKTHKDSLLFKRCSLEETDISEPELLEYDNAFYSTHGYMAAKVIAKEDLAQYISIRIGEISRSAAHIFGAGDHVPFQWTDTQIAFAELSLALVNSGSINLGKVELNEFTDYLGKVFNIEIENIYLKYIDIKRRKGDRTKYMTHLKNNLNTKIDKDLENS